MPAVRFRYVARGVRQRVDGIACVLAVVAIAVAGCADEPAAKSETWELRNGIPTLVDGDGNAIRRLELACQGFRIDGRHHDCREPRVHSLALSPDGTMLTYSRSISDGEEPPWELGVVRVDGSQQRTLIGPRREVFGGASKLSWASNGRTITYTYAQTRIETIDRSGGHRSVARARSRDSGPEP